MAHGTVTPAQLGTDTLQTHLPTRTVIFSVPRTTTPNPETHFQKGNLNARRRFSGKPLGFNESISPDRKPFPLFEQENRQHLQAGHWFCLKATSFCLGSSYLSAVPSALDWVPSPLLGPLCPPSLRSRVCLLSVMTPTSGKSLFLPQWCFTSSWRIGF